MQSGIENVPFYIQQNPLALYPSQGINIFLSPALSINPSQNFISSNPSMSSAQNVVMSNKVDQNNSLTSIIINTADNTFNNNLDGSFANHNNISTNPSDNTSTIITDTTGIVVEGKLQNEEEEEDGEEEEAEDAEEEEEEDEEDEEDEETEAVPELSEVQMSTYKTKIEHGLKSSTEGFSVAVEYG